MIRYNKQSIDTKVANLSKYLVEHQKTPTDTVPKDALQCASTTKHISDTSWKLLSAIALSSSILAGVGVMIKTDLDQKIDTKIDKLEDKFDTKIDKLDAKIDKLEDKFDAKIDKLDSKLMDLDKKIEILIAKLIK
jgi:outer membrane murein-binding lipoprotein Lpp